MIQGFTSGGDAQLRFHEDDWDGLRAAVAAACARANTVKEEVDESSDDGFGGKFRNGDDLQSLVRALRNGSGSHVYVLVDIESCCRKSWQDPFSCLHWVVMLSTSEEISSASPKKSETKLSTMVMMWLGDAHLVSEPLLVRWRMDNRY